MLPEDEQGKVAAALEQAKDAVEKTDISALTGALAWLECELTGEYETGDHVVVFGRVQAGDRSREGQPAYPCHGRKHPLVQS